jgi:hypothetical protein
MARAAPESGQIVHDPRIEEALRDAAQHISELSGYSAHGDLDALSSNTIFTGIDVYEDAIIREGDEYIAPATIYVELNYGGKSDAAVMGDSFPGTVRFIVKDNHVDIEDISVDTGSFYSDD